MSQGPIIYRASPYVDGGELPSDAAMLRWIASKNATLRPATGGVPEDGWIVMVFCSLNDGSTGVWEVIGRGFTLQAALEVAMKEHP